MPDRLEQTARVGRNKMGVYPLWLRPVLLVLMLVPLVGLLVLVVLSNRATSRLKQAGFQVGFLGARNY